MENLWSTAPVPRPRRTAYTVISSVAMHGAIIAVAALWPVRDAPPPPPGIITVITDPDLDRVELPSAAVSASVPAAAELDPPPPPTVETSADTPPPEEPVTMDFALPKPAPKTAAIKTRPAHPLVAPTGRGEPARPGVPGGAHNVIGAGAAGNPGATGHWKTTQPPYPYLARSARIAGSGIMRITTDGSGRVVSATVVQSTGNALLDANTSSYACTAWSGPPNASTTVPITYQLR